MIITLVNTLDLDTGGDWGGGQLFTALILSALAFEQSNFRVTCPRLTILSIQTFQNNFS